MRIYVALALTAFVTAGCRDSKPAKQNTPPPLEPQLEPRKPLVRPGVKGEVIEDGYSKARHVARGVLAPRAHTADAVFVVARDWSKASAPLRALGTDARSGEVSTLVSAGAAAADGTVPKGSAEEWAAVGAVAVAYAAERDLAGQTVDAAWQLLAATRMGYDLALGRTPPKAKHGLNLVGGALAALRSITQRSSTETLPTDDLAAVFAACRGLMDSTPTSLDPSSDKGAESVWTEGEWNYRYRKAAAELSATCFIIARVMEARGAKPAVGPIIDPVSGRPWQVDGAVLRGGTLDHQGAPEQLEFPLIGAP